jgi:uncharacterized membrane protein YbhN (UPF0104 family)/SAM-dependent methyltransferase
MTNTTTRTSNLSWIAEDFVSRRKWVKFIILSLLVILSFFVLDHTDHIDLDETLKYVKRINSPIITGALLLSCFQFLFQTLRSWTLCLPHARPKLATLSWIVLLGQTINTFAPMRSGDFARLFLLNKFKQNPESNVSDNIVSLSYEKAIDVTSLLLVVLFVGFRSKSNLPFDITSVQGLTISFFGIASAFFIFRLLPNTKVFTLLNDKVRSFLSKISSLNHLRQGVPALALTLASWITEACIILLVSNFFNYPISIDGALLALVVLNLGIAVPISLANVGVYEASMAIGLTRSGIPIHLAIAIAALHHFFQAFGVIIPLFFSLYFYRKDLKAQLGKDGFCVGVIDKEKALAYYESKSSDYNHYVRQGVLGYFRNRERNAIFSLSQLNQTPGTLIDVGCGGGFYSIAATEAKYEVTAVDASPGMIESIRGKVAHTQVADLETLKIDSQYDRVLCLGVLDFVLKPETSIKNLCKMVAPDGRLIILVPRSSWAGWIYRLEKKFSKIRVNLYHPEWLKKQVENEGLHLIQIEYPLPTNMVLAFKRPSSISST